MKYQHNKQISNFRKFRQDILLQIETLHRIHFTNLTKLVSISVISDIGNQSKTFLSRKNRTIIKGKLKVFGFE